MDYPFSTLQRGGGDSGEGGAGGGGGGGKPSRDELGGGDGLRIKGLSSGAEGAGSTNMIGKQVKGRHQSWGLVRNEEM